MSDEQDKLGNASSGNIPEELVGLATAVAEIDLADKQAVVKVGIALEKAWTVLVEAGTDKAVTGNLKTCLTALQKLYQDLIHDPAAVRSVLGRCVQAAEDHLAGKDNAAEEVDQAHQDLKDLLAEDESRASAPADESASEETSAEEAAPAADDDRADAYQTVPALQAMETLAAHLMGVDTSEPEALAALQQQLEALLERQDVAAAAVGHLTIAAAQLRSIQDGQAGEPDKALDNVAHALGQAADIQENTQLQAKIDQQEVASPAAEEPSEEEMPAEETPAEEPAEEEPPAEEPLAEKPPTKEKKPLPTIEFDKPAVLDPDAADPELLREYIVESLDHITNAEGALLELEGNPEDSDQINVVFRAFHTIKGTSGFLGLDRIQKCAHLAENLLDRAREGELKIMGGYADLSLRSCDCLRTMIEALHSVEAGQELHLPEDLMELLQILSDPEGAGYSEQGADEEASLRVGDILVAKGKVSREEIEEIEKSEDGKRIGEKLVGAGKAKAADVADAIRTQKQQRQGATSSTMEGSIRVGTGRLDSLINMVGELVIAQSMVAQAPEVSANSHPKLQRNVSHAGKIIRELQDLTMSLRMVPLKGVFQKMNRLVRDLGRKSGKKVQFITEGEDTEIDRNMVESLNDPLVHMIRNSVDHGLETPEERAETPKDPTGTVTLRAYHAAGNVVIQLIDDGRGLNKKKILAKAIEKGVIERNKDLSDQEIFMLIFAPGFSTADKITDVSGRGVGMDVVKRNIESLRGRIEVTSTPGEGSVFTIRLPLTMAITDAMILRVGREKYLLPTVSIEQSFQPDAGSISTVSGQGEMVMLRGELLPLFRLHNLFGVDDAVIDPYNGLLVVIEGDGKRCALMVDELLGQQQVVIKSLGQAMAKVPGVSGGAILGDGNVGLILDATGLLQLAEGRAEPEPAMV